MFEMILGRNVHVWIFDMYTEDPMDKNLQLADKEWQTNTKISDAHSEK